MVTNPQTPPVAAFSGNFIPLKFTSDAYIDEVGVKSNNRLIINHPVPNNTDFPITYGGKTINMVAKTTPDASGFQFPSGDGSEAYVASIIPYFKANYELNKDFEISLEATTVILFLAYEKNYGFDFLQQTVIPEPFGSYTGLYNWENGLPEIKKPNFAIFFQLYLQNKTGTAYDKVYETRLPIKFGTNTDAEIDISDKLDDALRAEAATFPNPQLQNAICRPYYYCYAESYGQNVSVKYVYTSANYTVTLGKLSYLGTLIQNLLSFVKPGVIASDRFLLLGSSTRTIRKKQPQYLPWFNSRDVYTNANLKAKFYFTDATNQTSTLQTINLALNNRYNFDITLANIPTSIVPTTKTVSYFEVWLESSTAVKISETRTYNIDYTYQLFARYFVYQNSLGGYDSLCFKGKSSGKNEIQQQEAKKLLQNGYSAHSGDTEVYSISINQNFKIATGYFKKADILLYRDFAASPKKYRFANGVFLPIAITNKTQDEFDDKSNLNPQNFEYKYLFTDDAISENDMITEDDNELDLIYPIYFGAANAVPISPSDVQLLPNNGISNSNPITLITGLNKIFVLAIPATKTLIIANNITANEDILTEYVLTSTITIAGINYKIYAMQMAVAYSETQTHILNYG